MSLLTLTSEEFCTATHACNEGREFALRYATMADVWDACPRPDWLLWVCRKVERTPDDRTLRLFAIWCARNTPLGDGRVTGDLITDPRSLAALEVAERHANGQATDAELTSASAYSAAYTYSASAYSAAYTYSASAYSAAYTYSAAAYSAAYAYARAAAYAYAYSASATAAADAQDYAADAQADQFRRMVANPFRKEAKP